MFTYYVIIEGGGGGGVSKRVMHDYGRGGGGLTLRWRKQISFSYKAK